MITVLTKIVGEDLTWPGTEPGSSPAGSLSLILCSLPSCTSWGHPGNSNPSKLSVHYTPLRRNTFVSKRGREKGVGRKSSLSTWIGWTFKFSGALHSQEKNVHSGPGCAKRSKQRRPASPFSLRSGGIFRLLSCALSDPLHFTLLLYHLFSFLFQNENRNK